MPIALDPTQTAPFHLRGDADRPEAARPTFHFHYLTRGEVRRLDALLRAAMTVEDDAAAERAIDDAIAIGLVGWSNVVDRDGRAVPFDPARLDDVLTGSEKYEMALRYPEVVARDEGLKKKSNSPSGRSSDNSAPVVAAAGAASPTPTGNV